MAVGVRILIADDSSLIQTILADLLASFECEVVGASTGDEALAALSRQGFDLVLLDLVMPGRDGLAVLHEFRAQGGPWVPVIVMTASYEHALHVRALTLGADHFLAKPLDEAVLLARVRALLDMRAVQTRLAAHAAALEQSRRELTEFLVHDIRTPLAVAGLDVELALRQSREPEAREPLVEALHALRRARGMLNDMLEIGRLDDAGIVPPIQPVETAILTRQVIATFREEAESRAVAVSLTGASPLSVPANRDLVVRALENLVGNALRHVSDGGRVQLSVRVDREFVEFAVANDGPPVPVERRELIFEKHVTGGPRSRPGSFGIGLYFCRRVAELHGGTISVSETPEWPTVFRLCLRAASTLEQEATEVIASEPEAARAWV